MKNRLFLNRIFAPAVGVFLFAGALYILHGILKKYHYHEIISHLRQLPPDRLLLALGLTALSYLLLTFYDALGFRYIKKPMPYPRIALGSFIGYSFSHNIGMALLTSGSVRYRLYSLWKVNAVEISMIVIFCGISFWLGLLTLGGVAMTFSPSNLVFAELNLPFHSGRLIGITCLAVTGLYLLFTAFYRSPIRFKGMEVSLPPFRLALSQVAVAATDWMIAASVLYVLLPKTDGLSYFWFLSVFMTAQFAGILSHVPGGLGVFETVTTYLLAPFLSAPEILGSLLAYRVIYYLVPFLLAILLFGGFEAMQRKTLLERTSDALGNWLRTFTPLLMAFAVFAAGSFLLFSSATPAVAERMGWLKPIIPLYLIEISHLLVALAGLGLILLAHALQRRYDGGWLIAVILLSLGIPFSLLKGLDYEEAILLAFMLGTLLPSRKFFYRKTSLLNMSFPPGWIAAICMAIIATLWIGIIAFRHVPYSHDLWLHFTFSGEAPRFLRNMGSVAGVLFLFILGRILRPAAPPPTLPAQPELALAKSIILQSPNSMGNLALLGDKRLLFNPEKNAFIMYGVEKRSWVALGDQIGPKEEYRELVWQFRELCDRFDGWPVFYQAHTDSLHLYLDMGLSIQKLGEEALVPLKTFSLEGGHRSNLRHSVHRLEREGYKFKIVPQDQVPGLLPELKTVSDAWLSQKKTREKGFSLGKFEEGYIRNFDHALILKRDKIMAFANLWFSGNKQELSVDLMRFLPEAPNGTMDGLFSRIMLWGKEQGYMNFNMGMAPMAGFENHPLAPFWLKAGNFLFRHGENFYNFQGLRQYKEKFDPVWEPRYLACPGGVAMPRILVHLASLISGGLTGLFKK